MGVQSLSVSGTAGAGVDVAARLVVRERERLGSRLSVLGGEFNRPRQDWGGATAPASGVLALTYFVAAYTETIDTLGVFCSTVSGATPTLIRFAVYSVDPAGAMTLTASSANNIAQLNSANQRRTAAITPVWTKVAGTVYALGLLTVSAAAMPSVYAIGVGTPVGGFHISALWEAPRLTAKVSGQSDLPASIAAGSLVASEHHIGWWMGP